MNTIFIESYVPPPLERVLHQKGQVPPLSLQGAFSVKELAAIATFKKDTTLERQGEFTLSTLQRAVLVQARDSRKLMIPAIKSREGQVTATTCSTSPSCDNKELGAGGIIG